MDEQNRGQWGSKIGFLLAVIGSAVGLGNIWRYPYIVYKYGGGAFLIPYFVAIIVAGIPILMLEYGYGHKFRGSTPLSFARANKKLEWISWVPTFASFVITTYYTVILGWAVNYLYHSFTFAWGNDTKAFFFNEFLHISKGPFQMGNLQYGIILTVVVVWLINWYVAYKGVSGGIEKLNKFLIPTLLVLTIIVVIRGITLPGASKGLNVLFTPKWEMLSQRDVWAAAFGQVFFSLSLSLGIIVTYSSYLPKKTDLNNSAIITAFANCGYEFLAAIGVFGILGYMAHVQNLPVDKVAGGGIGLAFIAFPKVFLTMGTFGKVIGVVFFLSLITAGLTSSVSLVEAFASAVIDKTGAKREKVVTLIALSCGVISLIYVTGAGLYILDIVDHYINYFVILVGALLECVAVWFIGAKVIREHNNKVSIVKIGKWWDVLVTFVVPAVLLFLVSTSVYDELTKGYDTYPTNALLVYGVGSLVVVFGLSFIATLIPWKKGVLELDYENDKE